MLAGLPLSAHAASFDCAKADKPEEIAICKSSELSQLDTEMGALWYSFNRVPMLMGASGERQDDERAFLKTRAACGNDVVCLRKVYQARITQLKNGIEQWMKTAQDMENEPPTLGNPLPPAVNKIAEDYAAQCKKLGGEMSGSLIPGIMTADLDRDNRQDYVLNPQNLYCKDINTAFCGNGGCSIKIALSSKEYANPLEALGGVPTIAQYEDGSQVRVWVDRTLCNLKDTSKACWATYVLENGKFTPRYEAEPLPVD